MLFYLVVSVKFDFPTVIFFGEQDYYYIVMLIVIIKLLKSGNVSMVLNLRLDILRFNVKLINWINRQSVQHCVQNPRFALILGTF